MNLDIPITDEERGYEAGRRRAGLTVLALAMDLLRERDSAEAIAARWVSERQEAIRALRELCAVQGDNDWPDSLCLADIIDNHVRAR